MTLIHLGYFLLLKISGKALWGSSRFYSTHKTFNIRYMFLLSYLILMEKEDQSCLDLKCSLGEGLRIRSTCTRVEPGRSNGESERHDFKEVAGSVPPQSPFPYYKLPSPFISFHCLIR